MNRQEVKKLAEITVMAGILFTVPIGYFYYRDDILRKWNSIYYR